MKSKGEEDAQDILTVLASFSSLSEALSREAASSSMFESPPRMVSTSGDSEGPIEYGEKVSGGFCQFASLPAASEFELSRDRLLRVDIAAWSPDQEMGGQSATQAAPGTGERKIFRNA